MDRNKVLDAGSKNIRIRLMTAFQKMHYEHFIQDRISNYVNCISVLTTYFTNNVLVHGLRACGEFIVVTALLIYLVYTQGSIVWLSGFFYFAPLPPISLHSGSAFAVWPP